MEGAPLYNFRDKMRPSRPIRLPSSVSSESIRPAFPNVSTIVTVDALLLELRKLLHSMFSIVDSNISTCRAYDNYSHQAFRFFTTTNSITSECFLHKVLRLGFHVTPRLCNELFRRIDHENLGEFDYAVFAQRVFLPESFYTSDEPHATTRSCLKQSSVTKNSAMNPSIVELDTREISSIVKRPNTARGLKLESHAGENAPFVSTKQLVAMLRERLDHVDDSTDRFQQAIKLFRKSMGISREDFHIAMQTLGLQMSPTHVERLFRMLDFTNTGELDVHKFVQGLRLEDNSTSFWLLSDKDGQYPEDPRRKLYSMAVASVQETWTIADIERMLREKIEQRTSRSSDCFRQAFRIFKKVNGINSLEFHAALEAIGLPLTRLQSDTLFRRFDKDASGDIDLNEFIHGVLPPDYFGTSWVAAADELHQIEAKHKKEQALAHPDHYMTEIEMETWTLDEIETRIRDKIQQATSRSSDTFRQAYKIFKKASHVTIDEFRERLLALGFRLTPGQCLGLFKRYDADNSNDLDLQEFCLKILPPDYTHDGDHWSHSERYKKERDRAKLESLKRSKNGLIKLPKVRAPLATIFGSESDESRATRPGTSSINAAETVGPVTIARPQTTRSRTLRFVEKEQSLSIQAMPPTTSPRGARPMSSMPLEKAQDTVIAYEDETMIDEGGTMTLAPYKSMRLVRHRRKQDKSSKTHASQVCVRLAESVTTVGTAKHMPQRNHVLLIKRILQATGRSSDSSKLKSIF